MSLFDWTFTFFSNEAFTQTALLFAFLDLILASFFRIAFNGLLKFRLRFVHGKGGS